MNPVTQFLALRSAAGFTRRQAADVVGARPSAAVKWERGLEETPEEVLSALRSLVEARDFPRLGPGGAFTFVDLFAGIGGMRQAFESAGGTCLMSSEWNPKAVETYAANFGTAHPIVGDVRALGARDVPDHDMLVAGFPCQVFSIAAVSNRQSRGLPHGFEDKTQGTLFFEVARVLKEKRPRAFLLENVKNLVRHDKGRTLAVIMETLRDELGYAVSWAVVDSQPWVPQKRERIFIVGFRDGPAFDFGAVATPEASPRLASILHRPGEPWCEDCPYAPGGVPLDTYTLTDGLWAYLQGHAARHRAAGNSFGFGLVGPDDVARTLSARYYKDGQEILVRQDGRNPRSLTPRECARLMGFDRPGLQPFRIPVSPDESFRQFGNSVVVPAIAAVALTMRSRLVAERSVAQAA